METIETPFKVGETYKNENGDSVKIVAIVPEFYQPIVAHLDGAAQPMSYDMDGKWAGKGAHCYNLIPPKTLPPLPAGREWHRPEAVTQEMIDEGFRPLLKGEIRHKGDEWSDSSYWLPTGSNGQPVGPGHGSYFRTKRPLPPSKKRVPLGPEDVPPGSVFRNTKGTTFPAKFYTLSEVHEHDIKIGSGYHPGWKTLQGEWEILRPGGTWEKCEKEVEA